MLVVLVPVWLWSGGDDFAAAWMRWCALYLWSALGQAKGHPDVCRQGFAIARNRQEATRGQGASALPSRGMCSCSLGAVTRHGRGGYAGKGTWRLVVAGLRLAAAVWRGGVAMSAVCVSRGPCAGRDEYAHGANGFRTTLWSVSVWAMRDCAVV